MLFFQKYTNKIPIKVHRRKRSVGVTLVYHEARYFMSVMAGDGGIIAKRDCVYMHLLARALFQTSYDTARFV